MTRVASLFLIFLVFFSFSCKPRGVNEKVNVRMIGFGLFLDGGSIAISYLDKSNHVVSIVIANNYLRAGASPIYNAARTGMVFFDGHPDEPASRMASKAETLKVLKELETWYYSNVSCYGLQGDIEPEEFFESIDEEYWKYSAHMAGYYYILKDAVYVKRGIALIKEGLSLRAKYSEEEILKYQKNMWPKHFSK